MQKMTFFSKPKVAYDHYLSHIVRKPAFCICENKDADQLHGKPEADHAFVFAT